MRDKLKVSRDKILKERVSLHLLFIVAVVLCLGISSFAATSPSVTNLAMPDEEYSITIDVNSAGTIIGNSISDVNGINVSRAVRWDKNLEGVYVGKYIADDIYINSYARAINDKGQILLMFNSKSYIYLDGILTELIIPYTSVQLRDINNNGIIVGNGQRSDGKTVGFWYNLNNGTSKEFYVDTDSNTRIVEINDNGWIVSNSSNSMNKSISYIYKISTEEIITIADELKPNQIFYSYAMNNIGQVIGDSVDVDSKYNGFIWDNGVFTYMQLNENPRSINDNGQIVGYQVVNGLYTPIFWFQDIKLSLSTLGGHSWSQKLNSNGKIVGVSNDILINVDRAVAWDTTPVATTSAFVVNQNSTLNGNLNAIDSDSSSFIYKLASKSPQNGTVTINPATKMFTYVPNENFVGTDSFTFTATCELGSKSDEATITINVLPVNLKPVAVDDILVLNEDETKIGNFKVISTGNSMNYTIVTKPTKGTLTITNPLTGEYKYVPFYNRNGIDSFKFKVTDGLLTSNDATVSITINPVNDAPIVSIIGTTLLKVNRTGYMYIIGFDLDSSNLSYTVTGLPTGAIFNKATRIFTWKPVTAGTYSVTFNVSDGKITTSKTVNLNVTK